MPVLEVGSITGRKGELIKKMCEETRARIRVVDAPVGTPDCIMCPNCVEDPPGSCSKSVSVMEENRNPNGLCSLNVLKSTKESSLDTVSETCVPIFMYKRMNGRGGSENIGFDKTSGVLRRIGDCDSTIRSSAPSTAEREASGAPIMPSLELDAKPNCANSQGPAGCCSKTVSVMEEKRNPNGLCSLSVLKSTKESSLGTVSGTCIPMFVYKRKNRQGGSKNIGFDKTSVVMRRICDCDSTNYSNAPSIAEKEACGAPIMPSSGSDAKPTCGNSQEDVPDEKPIEVPKIIDVDSVNDSCSSRSNAEPVSVPLKTGTEESGECSSSSVIAMEAQEDTPLSERDIFISILQSKGLLQKAISSTSCYFEDGNEISTINSYRAGSCKCKACCRSETARKMLICDYCDEAFHLSCCNSQVRSSRDDDEWLCTSCLTKKHILVRQTGNLMRLTRIGYEVDRSMLTPAAEKSSLISLMLRDTGPYQTIVRVGKGFQADVPDWTGPVKGDDMFGEPEELDTTVHSNLHVCSSSRPPKLSSICNWLQCKQVVDDRGETICGKWRRAPLFEVQTDDWECFCSIFWDPSHADCAVPQELDTDQVLKQLKYVEMLRPQLASKRRKLFRPQLNSSQQLTGTAKNTEKMRSLYKCKQKVL